MIAAGRSPPRLCMGKIDWHVSQRASHWWRRVVVGLNSAWINPAEFALHSPLLLMYPAELANAQTWRVFNWTEGGGNAVKAADEDSQVAKSMPRLPQRPRCRKSNNIMLDRSLSDERDHDARPALCRLRPPAVNPTAATNWTVLSVHIAADRLTCNCPRSTRHDGSGGRAGSRPRRITRSPHRSRGEQKQRQMSSAAAGHAIRGCHYLVIIIYTRVHFTRPRIHPNKRLNIYTTRIRYKLQHMACARMHHC